MRPPENETAPPEWEPGEAAKDETLGDALNRDSTTGRVANTARPQVGDVVHVHGVGRAHVIAADDPSLLTCQTAQGATFKVGEKSVERLEVSR